MRELVRESDLEKFSKDDEIYQAQRQADFFSLVMNGVLDVIVHGDQRKANKFQVLMGCPWGGQGGY